MIHKKIKLFCVIAISALSCTALYSQISINENLLLGQAWSKGLTKQIIETYVEINLEIENLSYKTYDVWSVTASSSGEISTAFYKSDDSKGVVFVLYQTAGGAGDFSIRDFPNEEGIRLVTQLDSFIEEFYDKKNEEGHYDHFVFRYDDVLFIISEMSLDVICNGMKSTWGKENARKFIRRVQKNY